MQVFLKNPPLISVYPWNVLACIWNRASWGTPEILVQTTRKISCRWNSSEILVQTTHKISCRWNSAHLFSPLLSASSLGVIFITKNWPRTSSSTALLSVRGTSKQFDYKNYEYLVTGENEIHLRSTCSTDQTDPRTGSETKTGWSTYCVLFVILSLAVVCFVFSSWCVLCTSRNKTCLYIHLCLEQCGVEYQPHSLCGLDKSGVEE